MIFARGLSRIQRVMTSPSSSRSLAFVAVKTLAPMTICRLLLLGEESRNSPRRDFPKEKSRNIRELAALHTLIVRLLQRRFGDVSAGKRLDGARLGVSNPPFPKGAHAWRHCSAVRSKLKFAIPWTRHSRS